MMGSDNDAMDLIIHYISRPLSGKTPEMCGYTTTGSPPKYRKSTASKKAPKVFLALQYVIQNFFRIEDVFAVRIGNSVNMVSKCSHAERCILIYYT